MPFWITLTCPNYHCDLAYSQTVCADILHAISLSPDASSMYLQHGGLSLLQYDWGDAAADDLNGISPDAAYGSVLISSIYSSNASTAASMIYGAAPLLLLVRTSRGRSRSGWPMLWRPSWRPGRKTLYPLDPVLMTSILNS